MLTPADYGTTWADILKMDPAVQKLWFAMVGTPPAAAWVPTYEEQHFVTVALGNGTSQTVPLNPQYFATDLTAKELMRRFDASYIALVPWNQGGPDVTSAMQRYLVWQDGIAINAGMLASNYDADRAPETGPNPGLADKMSWDAISRARQRGEKLPEQKPAV